MEDTQELLITQNLNEQNPHMPPLQIRNSSVFQNWWGSSQPSQPISRSQRVSCEYCREVSLAQHYEHHKRICRRNPVNLRESQEFIPTERVTIVITTERSRNSEPLSTSSSNLNKSVCEFCNEPCYLRFRADHMRVCVKNPENIKVICRFCTKTFCQNSFNSHVEACAEKMEYKENAFLLRLEELAKREGDSSSSEQLAEGDCPICIEEIKKSSESRKLSCGHRFHRRCIEMWGRRQKRCPICRKGFV